MNKFLNKRFKIGKKAFTLIELIVVIAVIGVLVLLAMPKFMNHTKEAREARVMNSVKVVENASERYFIDNDDWPRLTGPEDYYSQEEMATYAQNYLDATGKEITLDLDGHFYNIDWDKLAPYVKEPKDGFQYILQDPVGRVFYLNEPTEAGKVLIESLKGNTPELPAMTGSVRIDSSGAFKVGDVLTANISNLVNAGDNPTYQWYRGTTEISGANSKTYTLAEADVDSQIKVRVSADTTVSTGSLESNPTDVVEVAVVLDDPSGAPGAKTLIAGNMTAGFFGEVKSSDLFTGTEIASAVGITEGIAQNSDAGWLKFAIEDKIIYKSKKSFRYWISWDHIDSKGAVFGTKTVIDENGNKYKVRLMKGLHDDATGYNGASNHGSEWNRLMLPIHKKAKDQSWAYPSNVTTPTEYWGIDLTDEDLNTHYTFGIGSHQWMQETYDSSRVVRGCRGVSFSDYLTSSYASVDRGWSPVLELVNP